MATEPTGEAFVVPGINDKRRLLGFFAAKNHHNLVLRVADLRELPLPAQHTLVGMFKTWAGLEWSASHKEPAQFFIHNSLDGYVVVPFELLLQAELPIIQDLQHILVLYRDVRRGKGEPSRVDPCECKGAAGCKKCHGAGQIVTFIEMAPEERQLAEREQPGQRSSR